MVDISAPIDHMGDIVNDLQESTKKPYKTPQNLVDYFLVAYNNEKEYKYSSMEFAYSIYSTFTKFINSGRRKLTIFISDQDIISKDTNHSFILLELAYAANTSGLPIGESYLTFHTHRQRKFGLEATLVLNMRQIENNKGGDDNINRFSYYIPIGSGTKPYNSIVCIPDIDGSAYKRFRKSFGTTVTKKLKSSKSVEWDGIPLNVRQSFESVLLYMYIYHAGIYTNNNTKVSIYRVEDKRNEVFTLELKNIEAALNVDRFFDHLYKSDTPAKFESVEVLLDHSVLKFTAVGTPVGSEQVPKRTRGHTLDRNNFKKK